jgi:hypothetical protein
MNHEIRWNQKKPTRSVARQAEEYGADCAFNHNMLYVTQDMVEVTQMNTGEEGRRGSTS